MSLSTIGDLAGHLFRSSQNSMLKTRIEQSAKEYTTGIAADLGAHLKGNFSTLAEVRHDLRMLSSFSIAAQEAATRTGATQNSLGSIQDELNAVSANVLTTVDSENAVSLGSLALDAEAGFALAVASLNGRANGQSLFAGAAVRTSALESADAILTQLRADLTGVVTYADFQNTIDDWFDAPAGGFETFAYLGATQDAPDYVVTDGAPLSNNIRADDSALRAVLKSFAKAALAMDTSFGFSASTQSDVIRAAGEEMIGATDQLTSLRAALGTVEEQIEQTSVRNAAQQTSLRMLEQEMIGIDQYQAATELQNAQTNLEGLYAVTVRLSQLSLVNFLR